MHKNPNYIITGITLRTLHTVIKISPELMVFRYKQFSTFFYRERRAESIVVLKKYTISLKKKKGNRL